MTTIFCNEMKLFYLKQESKYRIYIVWIKMISELSKKFILTSHQNEKLFKIENNGN